MPSVSGCGAAVGDGAIAGTVGSALGADEWTTLSRGINGSLEKEGRSQEPIEKALIHHHGR
ncbi:hypothetical protein [Salinibacter ruber]|jgi:hypothetical protein|uniref:Uncharacterized protein n=1 Tax=Salinibacter ruber TaxID=146919 RepID=A0A9X2U6Z0_9BACT|nr:hypothetical protein [Salinibacter ruber]MCS3655672.1 hypothetical protein [Salinibacter ruber]MCS3950817.1 hypothetical protein [Salinibacter ruber]MCS4116831.1 hypothetical protein [Salinibacter ruber]MCS4152750.1 hypothetical protein [Salinibacter ruber]MCS4168563.1 hypothetical protein [Salinibacter ruber]